MVTKLGRGKGRGKGQGEEGLEESWNKDAHTTVTRQLNTMRLKTDKFVENKKSHVTCSIYI